MTSDGARSILRWNGRTPLDRVDRFYGKREIIGWAFAGAATRLVTNRYGRAGGGGVWDADSGRLRPLGGGIFSRRRDGGFAEAEGLGGDGNRHRWRDRRASGECQATARAGNGGLVDGRSPDLPKTAGPAEESTAFANG